MTITLKRVYLPTETLGSMYDESGKLLCKTMELPWKENRSNISCIPEGTYQVVKQPPKEDRPYPYFRFKKVDGRGINPANKMSTILIHKITYVSGLKGCIGVGTSFADFNKDGVPDMADSTKALEHLHDVLPDEFTLIITKK